MGDDDLVSIELAARNFKFVTVLDCDINLLKKLKILTQGSKFQINFFHVDLYHGLPKFLYNIFDVVCFDPPQNYIDLNSFLGCALNALKSTSSSFYMMVNSYALGQNKTEDIITQLQKIGFINTQKLDFFNCYPLNKGQSFLLNIMAYFTHSFSGCNNRIGCKYYFTDCLEFKLISFSQAKDQISEEKQIVSGNVGHFSLPDLPIAFYKQYNSHNKKTIN